MIKKWLERLPSRLPLTQQACTLVQTSCMQAEIDELRKENERLKAALLTNDTTIESANNAAGMLEAENARMGDALIDVAAIHAWLAFGECRAFGTGRRMLTSAEAD